MFYTFHIYFIYGNYGTFGKVRYRNINWQDRQHISKIYAFQVEYQYCGSDSKFVLSKLPFFFTRSTAIVIPASTTGL